MTQIPPDTRMCLFYPQCQMPGDSSVYMRTHLVNANTAEVSVGWALVFHVVDGKPVRLVRDFTC